MTTNSEREERIKKKRPSQDLEEESSSTTNAGKTINNNEKEDEISDDSLDSQEDLHRRFYHNRTRKRLSMPLEVLANPPEQQEEECCICKSMEINDDIILKRVKYSETYKKFNRKESDDHELPKLFCKSTLCDHSYHFACIIYYIDVLSKDTCPLCRVKIKIEE